MEKSFWDLCRIHENLTGLFFEHQKALLDGDIKKAKAYLRKYRLEIQDHAGLEEEWLIPLYEERAEIRPGGDVSNFIGEHSKILMFLNRLENNLNLLEEKEDYPKGLIALLDDEARYKELVRHHEEREERFLFAELERVVTETEKVKLLQKMESRV
jgi:hemerythrin-like domain-containing protein